MISQSVTSGYAFSAQESEKIPRLVVQIVHLLLNRLRRRESDDNPIRTGTAVGTIMHKIEKFAPFVWLVILSLIALELSVGWSDPKFTDTGLMVWIQGPNLFIHFLSHSFPTTFKDDPESIMGRGPGGCR